MTHSKNNIEHIIHDNGDEAWCHPSNANYHQDKDVPSVIDANGTEEYWKKGKLFRKYGPTIKHPDGNEAWNTKTKNGWHREDGAAMIETNGKRIYWLKGNIVTYDEFRKQQNKTRNPV